MQNTIILALLGKNAMTQVLLIGAIIVVFYVFSIRPQQKKHKTQKQFLEGIKNGTPLVTIGGIHGQVVQVDKDTVKLAIDHKGTSLVIEKSAISLETSKKNLQKKVS